MNSLRRRLHCPDARFSIPGFSTKKAQKNDVTLNWIDKVSLSYEEMDVLPPQIDYFEKRPAETEEQQ